MNTAIKHNAQLKRFEVEIQGHTAFMSYLLDDEVINYNHTLVPRTLGGQGIGTELVKYGLAYARVNHFQVMPSCPFVAAIINKHEVYQDLLVTD